MPEHGATRVAVVGQLDQQAAGALPLGGRLELDHVHALGAGAQRADRSARAARACRARAPRGPARSSQGSASALSPASMPCARHARSYGARRDRATRSSTGRAATTIAAASTGHSARKRTRASARRLRNVEAGDAGPDRRRGLVREPDRARRDRLESAVAVRRHARRAPRRRLRHGRDRRRVLRVDVIGRLGSAVGQRIGDHPARPIAEARQRGVRHAREVVRN